MSWWIIALCYIIIGIFTYYLLVRYRNSIFDFLFWDISEEESGFAFCFFSICWIIVFGVIILIGVFYLIYSILDKLLKPIRNLAEKNRNKNSEEYEEYDN